MPSRQGMYETECVVCGKKLYSFATDRRGTLPEATCSLICKSKRDEEKKKKGKML